VAAAAGRSGVHPQVDRGGAALLGGGRRPPPLEGGTGRAGAAAAVEEEGGRRTQVEEDEAVGRWDTRKGAAAWRTPHRGADVESSSTLKEEAAACGEAEDLLRIVRRRKPHCQAEVAAAPPESAVASHWHWQPGAAAHQDAAEGTSMQRAEALEEEEPARAVHLAQAEDCEAGQRRAVLPLQHPARHMPAIQALQRPATFR
jgi:hypothetical protein